MKETKVYVDKMPEDCWDCLIHNGEDGHCKILNNFTDYISKDCPLIDIKAHDRELVRQVCEIIREIGLQYNIEDLSGVFISYKALDQIQKDLENENNKN